MYSILHQDMELAQEKVEDLDVDQEESIIKDQQDVEDGKSRSSPSSQDPADHGDSSKSISTDGSRESSEHRASGDDRARMGWESSERRHSGSGDWSKPEDRSHEDDRQYHDNRSHGSSRFVYCVYNHSNCYCGCFSLTRSCAVLQDSNEMINYNICHEIQVFDFIVTAVLEIEHFLEI